MRKARGLLQEILVVDFSILLPGPLATLMLAECGAQVIKIERPGSGDPMRSYRPRFGTDSVNFAMLNRGKETFTSDLKDPETRPALNDLLRRADVLVEQFRPGAMKRLDLGYDDVRELNPDIIYCSISGYGQTGPNAEKAGHDLNYMAETGCLSLSGGENGAPVLPPILAADIAGGAYPAVINILMGLCHRRVTGEGCHLDIAMADNLYTAQYWALGEGFVENRWARPSTGLVTGRSPRYQIYRTADERYLAVAALEEPFWQAFCDIIALDEYYRDDTHDPVATQHRVAQLIANHTAAEWQLKLSGRETCCSVVATLDEAIASEQTQARGLFNRLLEAGNIRIPALPLPINNLFRDSCKVKEYPSLDQ